MDKEDKAIVILVLLGMLLVVTGIALISIPAFNCRRRTVGCCGSQYCRAKSKTNKKMNGCFLVGMAVFILPEGGEIKDG